MPFFKYKDNVVESAEELADLLTDEGVVKRLDDWTTSTRDKQKFYNAQEFLKDADYYYNMTPQNLVQTASKLWLACVYTVKDYFLDIGIHAVSHRSLKFLTTVVIDNCQSVNMAVKLVSGWNEAEKFHLYSNGSDSMNPKHFGSGKSEVEYFVENFSTIDKTAVKQDVVKLVNNPSEKIQIKSDVGKATMGKKTYQFNYKAF